MQFILSSTLFIYLFVLFVNLFNIIYYTYVLRDY